MAQICASPMGMPWYAQSPVVFPEIGTGNVGDHYCNEEFLGSGSTCSVYKVYDKVTQLPYACKMLSKRNRNFNGECVRKEVYIMLKLSGQRNVVNLRGIFENSDYVFLIMDLCPGGDLFRFIAGEHPAGCSEQLVFHVMLQIMTAIQSCHALGVVHSDLKPENIMLCESNTNGPLVKLVDFGLSSVMEGEKVNTIAGTPSYMAPEVFQGSYGCGADIWSAGCIMYALFSGNLPFDLEEVDIFSRAAQWKQLWEYQEFLKQFPFSDACKSMSENAKDVLFKMLAMDPSVRMTAEEFLQHPWALQHMKQLHAK